MGKLKGGLAAYAAKQKAKAGGKKASPKGGKRPKKGK